MINISLIIIQINLDVDLAVPSISFVYRCSAYKPSVTLSVNHRRFRLLKRDYSVTKEERVFHKKFDCDAFYL